jgi:chemotaxis signal transduction protein
MSMLETSSVPRTWVTPYEDRIISIFDLAIRWGIHPAVAKRRAKAIGLPVLKFNERAFGVRLSDVLRIEKEAEDRDKIA